MTTGQVIDAMRRGALLHMEHRDGEMVFWLTKPFRTISPRVARCVISCDETKPKDDWLLPGSLSQTWAAAT